jgi:hypothetical protein
MDKEMNGDFQADMDDLENRSVLSTVCHRVRGVALGLLYQSSVLSSRKV